MTENERLTRELVRQIVDAIKGTEPAEPDAETLSGAIMELAGTVLRQGQTIEAMLRLTEKDRAELARLEDAAKTAQDALAAFRKDHGFPAEPVRMAPR